MTLAFNDSKKKQAGFLPFQNGILLSDKSLVNLYNDLKSFNTDVSYIMTNRLNQDVLENLFGYIRAMGAAHDNPAAIDIRYRLRWYILGKHSSDVFTEGSNTKIQDTTDETCLTSMELPVEKIDKCFENDDMEFPIGNVNDVREGLFL